MQNYLRNLMSSLLLVSLKINDRVALIGRKYIQDSLQRKGVNQF